MTNLIMLQTALANNPERGADLLRAAYWLGASEGIKLQKDKPDTAQRSIKGMAQAYADPLKLKPE